jgi:lipopolysaccharide/colanic/teichoic acid biosynthesis glycosyltransferase
MATLRFPRPTHQRRDVRHAPIVLAEDVFLDALKREFKRADRFEEPFALLLVAFGDERSEATRREVVEAVTTAMCDTDIVGWFEQNTVVGLIRPLAQTKGADAAASLAAAVQHQLLRAVRTERPATCSIRIEVFSTETRASSLSPALRGPTVGDTALEIGKRALDVAGSVSLLLLLSPVFLLVSSLIKLTSNGPVLFKQERVGQDGRPFTMLKFRTMHLDADHAIHKQYVTEFIQSGASARSADTVFKIVDDPRVTSLGHFLRRSSLDELPQFLNVLKGDMSLVGPRPSLPYEVERYKAWHRRRLHEAKPGITGLWQVTGRSRTTFDEMVRLDLQYARSCSLWGDIKILLATPRAVVSGKGAH